MKRTYLIAIILFIVLVGILYFYSSKKAVDTNNVNEWEEATTDLSALRDDQKIEETSFQDSPTVGWWLNSGGEFTVANNIGSTLKGTLSPESKWAKAYATANSLDTDQGLRPQNIFRLVYRNSWPDVEQQACFYIDRSNLSRSENRNQSNGIFLLNHYMDGNNLYYTGLRVDGEAVIKKKQNGVYTTLAAKKILPGSYDRENNPNLLPEKQWIGIKSKLININSEVYIEVFTDTDCKEEWTSQLKVNDTSQPIEQGDSGIRTDFMDVQFKDYRLIKLQKKT